MATKKTSAAKLSLTWLSYSAFIAMTALLYAAVKLLRLSRPGETSAALNGVAVSDAHRTHSLDMEQGAVGSEPSMADVRHRLDKYMTNHYLDLHVAVLSVTLGVAGLVAASLLTNHELGSYRPVFGMLWIASLLATLAAYAGTVTGAVALPPRVPSMLDLIPPVLISITESLLFAVLAPQLTGSHPPRKILIAWFFCLAAFGAFAAGAVARARHLYQPTNFAEEFESAVSVYRKFLKGDILGAGTTAAVGATGGAMQVLRPHASLAAGYCFAVAILIMLALALVGHSKTARHWRQVLTPTPDRGSPDKREREAART